MGGQGEKTRILLADAQYVVRQGIRRTFEAEPDLEIVGEVDNGREAVNLARELSPDAIIIDARLPKLDSVEVVRRIKEQHPETAILVLSLHQEECSIELLRAGVDGYLLKSTKGDELVQAMRSIRAGMFVCDPRVEQTLLKQAARSQPVAVDFGQRLTRREAEVLELMIKGMSNHDIAGHLGLAERTIKGYVMSIFGKMGVRSRTEAVLEALRRGWIDLKDK